MNVTIRSVRSRRDLKKFIRLPWKIYRNDPAWIPPLIQERLQFLNKKKNPFFEHAEAELFLAERGGEIVGRISAHIDRLHNQTHHDKTGFFGLFEAINDPEVAEVLLNQAAAWLRERGMKTIRGPCSFSMNEEPGVLIEGFECPPFPLMNHTPRYYPQLLERWGMKKIKDLYAWRYDATKPVPEAPLRIAEEVRKHPGLRLREVSKKTLDRDIWEIMEVVNSAWQNNWGFVPLTKNEIRKAAKDFKLFLDPKVAFIAEMDGKPAAICLAIPNIHEAIKDLNGRLFPFGFFKLLYRIKARKIRSARLMLLGVKKEYRGSVLGGLSVLLYVKIHQEGKTRGYTMGELSWTLEDNQKINAGIEFMGGERYKTYRIYERTI